MSKYIANDKTPAEAIHGGEILKDELKARNIKQKDFTAELAVKIENAIGIDAEFWLRLQAKYEIDLVRIKMKNQIKQANITPAKKQTLIKAVA